MQKQTPVRGRKTPSRAASLLSLLFFIMLFNVSTTHSSITHPIQAHMPWLIAFSSQAQDQTRGYLVYIQSIHLVYHIGIKRGAPLEAASCFL
jgi:hypothetical protein